MEEIKKNILIAPLNWGLGHATRCIPIIKALEVNGYNPIIASDGVALALLQKEFPHLQSLELPSYHIKYPKNGNNFKFQLIKNSPKMIRAIFKEKEIIGKWITQYNLSGIISDNRLGVRSKKIPSVFITHQLNVMSGNTTWITSKIHLNIIKKFNQCWVPDVATTPNLTGDLGHLKVKNKNIKYIGPLSRLHKQDIPQKYDLMVMLSGPEPQRTLLEEKLIKELEKYKGTVIFIKGIVEASQTTTQKNHITFYNYMNTCQLETAYNQSKLVLCRSGYTTVMDLAQLGKKAFFIPTPGQFEQEYLAQKYNTELLVSFASQDDFNIDLLQNVAHYKGLLDYKVSIDWEALFGVFKLNK